MTQDQNDYDYDDQDGYDDSDDTPLLVSSWECRQEGLRIIRDLEEAEALEEDDDFLDPEECRGSVV